MRAPFCRRSDTNAQARFSIDLSRISDLETLRRGASRCFQQAASWMGCQEGVNGCSESESRSQYRVACPNGCEESNPLLALGSSMPLLGSRGHMT